MLKRNVPRFLLRAIGLFLVVMLLFALLCVRLFQWRTPRVTTVAPRSRSLVVEGQAASYAAVLPAQCVTIQNDSAFVYLLEETSSQFKPYIVRQTHVAVEAGDGTYTAVQGALKSDSRVVEFASGSIQNESGVRPVFE